MLVSEEQCWFLLLLSWFRVVYQESPAEKSMAWCEQGQVRQKQSYCNSRVTLMPDQKHSQLRQGHLNHLLTCVVQPWDSKTKQGRRNPVTTTATWAHRTSNCGEQLSEKHGYTVFIQWALTLTLTHSSYFWIEEPSELNLISWQSNKHHIKFIIT